MLKRVLLVINGGIAAYKSLDLIRLLRTRGVSVRCVPTAAALNFVTPLALQTLSGESVHHELFSLTQENDIGHIALARESDLVIVCPATANFIAKMRFGLCDDLASTLLLATRAPILVAPAMNPSMWHHATTQENVAHLQGRGVRVVGPDNGEMACKEHGTGRLAALDTIVAEAFRLFAENQSDHSLALSGVRALVTAGPTVEALDLVRYLSNYSSGRQGYAIAASLQRMGADVTLVSGPTALCAPSGVERIEVKSADDMLKACRRRLPFHVAICTAAVCDWKAVAVSPGKIKKNSGKSPPVFALTETPDILATLGKKGRSRPELVIGFAAEASHDPIAAQTKRHRKNCDWLCVNNIADEPEIFGGAQNRITLYKSDAHEAWPLLAKEDVADRLSQHIARAISPEYAKSEHYDTGSR